MTALYDIKKQPVLQQKVYRTREEAISCLTGDICLAQDPATGIVSNISFDPSLVVYDENYACDQSVSDAFKKHLENVEGILSKHFKQDSVIEVGCGKGYFLEYLQARGYQILGFDKTYEGTNPSVSKSFFDHDSGVSANGLLLRHVLEHIQDPVAFITSLKEVNKGKGLIYIEVPCFEWVMKNRTFFDITYEHVNYFRLGDFYRIFGNVIEAGHIFGEQYIYVIADLASVMPTPFTPDLPIAFPLDFLEPVSTHLSKFSAEAKVSCGIWGAAGKGVQYALAVQRALGNGTDGVKIAIDTNPAKQNMYLAGSGAKVYAPSDILNVLPAGSNIIVMNPNYLAEIKQLTNNIYQYHAV
jgi:SAM-dependent methyltransferase